MDYRKLNDTELVQLCRDAGLAAHRGVPRGALIQMLMTKEQTACATVLDTHRAKMREFLDEYGSLIRTQLSCDTNCPECPDALTAPCRVLNQTHYGGKD